LRHLDNRIHNIIVTTDAINRILDDYRQLLLLIDSWFSNCIAKFPDEVNCCSGCSGCCRGIFDITILDAWFLKTGFDLLPSSQKSIPLKRALTRAGKLIKLWPDFSVPYILNIHPEKAWDLLIHEEDETPCPLLTKDGKCLVYDYRPMTCRLHGTPLIDLSGEFMHDDWCSENFTNGVPQDHQALQGPFIELFRQEVRLGRQLHKELLGIELHELDTLIPTALLVDYLNFDWNSWWQVNRERILTSAAINLTHA